MMIDECLSQVSWHRDSDIDLGAKAREKRSEREFLEARASRIFLNERVRIF